jgi:hypothetical protein
MQKHRLVVGILLHLEQAQEFNVLGKHGLVYLILRGTAILDGHQQVGAHQLHEVVRNRGLCQVENFHQPSALHPVLFPLDGFHKFQPVRVAHRFSDFSNLFRIH